MAAESAIDETGAAEGDLAAASSQPRSDSAQKTRLWATILLVVILALLTVRLLFAVITPLQRPSAEAPIAIAADNPVNLTIFERFDPFQGNVPAPELAPVVATSETQLNLKLFGTFLGEPASAIVQGANSRQGVYFLGDEIDNGVTIEEIRNNQILLNRRGVLETLTLENREADDSASQGVVSAVTQNASGAGGISDLADYIRIQPDPSGQGILLFAGRQPQVFEVAGLINGDKLIAIDGVALSSTGRELAGLPARLARGPLEITVERNGTPLVLEIELTGLIP